MSKYQQQNNRQQPQQYQAPVLEIKKAVKSDTWLRMALIGVSGSGKTFSALSIAKGLGKRIMVIDTEHGSAAKYADLFDFETIALNNFDPRNYIEGLRLGEMAEFDVIIIDSLSHAWSGRGGALEIVDNITKRTNSGNSFAAWRDVTPLHNQLVDAIVGCQAHVIVTMRAKTEYVYDSGENGKKGSPRKIGMAPIQREGMEYEFDVCGDINQSHEFIVTKSRVPWLADQIYPCPGQKLGEDLLGWLGKPMRVERPADPGLTVSTPRPQSAPNYPQQPTSSQWEKWADLKRKVEDLGLRRLNPLPEGISARNLQVRIDKVQDAVDKEQARVDAALAEQERKAQAEEYDDSDPFEDEEPVAAPAPLNRVEETDDSDPFEDEDSPAEPLVGSEANRTEGQKETGTSSVSPTDESDLFADMPGQVPPQTDLMTAGQARMIDQAFKKLNGRDWIGGDFQKYIQKPRPQWTMQDACTILELINAEIEAGQ